MLHRQGLRGYSGAWRGTPGRLRFYGRRRGWRRNCGGWCCAVSCRTHRGARCHRLRHGSLLLCVLLHKLSCRYVCVLIRLRC